MRMRLRAPDLESSHEENEDDGNGSEQCTTESCHQLPLLDVGSPEYIEERLENLKRRPKWRDFLDQYVQDHPESDSESETSDLDEVLVQDAPGFVRWTLWSLLVVALAPLLVLCAPFLRHQGYGFWPLGCRSMKELFGCAVAHVISMVGGLGLLYWTICRELPDVFHVGNTLVKLNAQIDEMLHTVETCHLALLQWERAVAQELCMPVAIDAALLLVNVYLLLHCHCRRARYLMALMVVIFVADVPTKLYDLTFPAPEIHEVDPNYAMVDEELLVALDGKNLKQGGSVAWVAYWGCAVTSNVDACETQFVSTFEAGNVAVTFKSIDYFIPCYRDPPNPLKAQEYKCFEHVRIRVKDKRSIPGWSRSATRSLIISQPAEAVTLRSIERLDGFKMITFKSEKGLLSSTVSQDVVEAPSSKRSIVALMESSASIEIPVPPEYGVTDNDEPFGLDTEGVRLSSEGDTGIEIEGGVSEAVDKELIEVEVTPDAEMKMISLHVKPDAVHRRDKAALPLQSPQIVSYIQEVTLRKYQNQEEAISAGSADELEPTLSVTEMVLEVCTDEGAECMEEGAERIEEGAKLMNEGPADDAMTTASDEGKILRRPDRTTDEEDENVVRNWKKTLEQAHTRLP